MSLDQVQVTCDAVNYSICYNSSTFSPCTNLFSALCIVHISYEVHQVHKIQGKYKGRDEPNLKNSRKYTFSYDLNIHLLHQVVIPGQKREFLSLPILKWRPSCSDVALLAGRHTKIYPGDERKYKWSLGPIGSRACCGEQFVRSERKSSTWISMTSAAIWLNGLPKTQRFSCNSIYLNISHYPFAMMKNAPSYLMASRWLQA